MRRTLALVAALASAAAAVLLLLAAFDVQRWERAFRDGDARYRTVSPATPLWRTDTLLPGDPAGRALAVADDVRYRRAVLAFLAAKPRDSAAEQPELHAARISAHVQLRESMEADGDPLRRAHTANLLGALTAAVAPSDEERRNNALGSAGNYFIEAIRLDRANDHAKFNLESVLRQLRESPRSYESPGGRQPRDDASMGGVRDAGAGY